MPITRLIGSPWGEEGAGLQKAKLEQQNLLLESIGYRLSWVAM